MAGEIFPKAGQEVLQRLKRFSKGREGSTARTGEIFPKAGLNGRQGQRRIPRHGF